MIMGLTKVKQHSGTIQRNCFPEQNPKTHWWLGRRNRIQCARRRKRLDTGRMGLVKWLSLIYRVHRKMGEKNLSILTGQA